MLILGGSALAIGVGIVGPSTKFVVIQGLALALDGGMTGHGQSNNNINSVRRLVLADFPAARGLDGHRATDSQPHVRVGVNQQIAVAPHTFMMAYSEDARVQHVVLSGICDRCCAKPEAEYAAAHRATIASGTVAVLAGGTTGSIRPSMTSWRKRSSPRGPRFRKCRLAGSRVHAIFPAAIG
jgi:hypothetical protein